MKVLKGQSYHKQALMSKSLLALYQHYLKQMRAKSFRRYYAFKKYFKVSWMQAFKKNTALKKILSNIMNKQNMLERTKYQRQFEVKKQAL